MSKYKTHQIIDYLMDSSQSLSRKMLTAAASKLADQESKLCELYKQLTVTSAELLGLRVKYGKLEKENEQYKRLMKAAGYNFKEEEC